MKTKHKILSVLAIMAILAGLCVAMVTTASASTQVIASAKASPATVNSSAAWVVELQKNPAVYNSGVTITLTLPTGVVMPATVGYTYVSVEGVNSKSGDVISVSGQSVLITINSDQATAINADADGDGRLEVAIQAGAGIKNPPVAKSIASGYYILKAKSGLDTTDGTINIGFIPTYSINPTESSRLSMMTVIGQGWAPNAGIAVQGALTGNATTDATGSFTASAYYSDAGVAGIIAKGFVGNEVLVTDGLGQTSFTTTGGAYWAASNAGGETPVIPTFKLLPSITVNPTSGDVGSTFVVKGTDFTSGSQINIGALTIGGIPLNTVAIPLSSKDGTGTNDDFEFTATVPVKNPFTNAPMNTGAQLVVATDAANKSGSGSFNVNAPTVTVDPASGAPGTTVTLTGTHFCPQDTIQVSYAGPPVVFGIDWAGIGLNTQVIQVNGSGGWTYDSKAPTGAKSGYNIIVVTTTNGTKAGTYFAVGARSLNVNPSSGPLGTQIVIGGTDMSKAVGADVVIRTQDVKIAQVPAAAGALAATWWPNGQANIKVDSTGNIQATTLQIPNQATVGLTKGVLTVSVTDFDQAVPQVIATQATAEGKFTVVPPVLTVTPAAGVVGTVITVVGTGFVPNDYGISVQITNQTNQQVKLLGRPVVDAAGAFTLTANVPYNIGLGLGDLCKVEVIDQNYANFVDPKTFKISQGSVTSSPATGPAGTLVTVTGAGLLPGNKINAVSVDGWDVTPDKLPQVDMAGSVTATFTVPAFIQTGVKVINITVVDANKVETTYSTFITVTAGGSAGGTSVTARLAAIDGEYDQVWTLDAGTWKLFDPSDAANAEFTTLTPGMAIYIHTTQAVDNVALGGVVRNLVIGWNMIGWVS